MLNPHVLASSHGSTSIAGWLVGVGGWWPDGLCSQGSLEPLRGVVSLKTLNISSGSKSWPQMKFEGRSWLLMMACTSLHARTEEVIPSPLLHCFFASLLRCFVVSLLVWFYDSRQP